MSLTQTIVVQVLQVLFVWLVSPLIKGILDRMKEFVQGKRGPSIWQVYRDLRKQFNKENLIPHDAGPLYHLAPYLYFAAPLVVTLLIPVLTSKPLFMAFAGDMLSAGFILGLGAWFLLGGSISGASPYAGVGNTRARFISMTVEPVLILVLFAVSFVAHSTLPYVVNQTLQSLGWSPVHLLLIAAFFSVFLAETGRIPVDNPSSHREFSMIDHNRAYDYSGPYLALIEWGGNMKFVVLGVILLNVLTSPFGLSPDAALLSVAVAVIALFIKFLILDGVIVWVESSFGKLRLLRIAEFMAGGALCAALAIVAQLAHL
ncbi:MAG: respiratory chain complex I subunit 1 family protein [Bacilli bacterium]